MTNEQLQTFAKRLNFDRNKVYLDDKEILALPTKGVITHLTVTRDNERNAGKILVGKSFCCHGPVAGLVYQEWREEPGVEVAYVTTPDLNVEDTLPLSLLSSADPFLVAGMGCAGAGIRLINGQSLKMEDIVSTDEYHNLRDGRQLGAKFKIDQNRILLNLIYNRSNRVATSVDITDRLKERVQGFNDDHIDKISKNYVRIPK